MSLAIDTKKWGGKCQSMIKIVLYTFYTQPEIQIMTGLAWLPLYYNMTFGESLSIHAQSKKRL